MILRALASVLAFIPTSYAARLCDHELWTALAPFDGTVYVVDADGHEGSITSFHPKQFMTAMPRFRAAAAAVGFTSDETEELALTLARSLSIQMQPGQNLTELCVALERLAARNLRLTGHAAELAQLTVSLGRHDLTELGFLNLALAMDAGFTFAQASRLLLDMQERGRYLAADPMGTMPDLLNAIRLYHADAATVFDGLLAVVRTEHGPAAYTHLAAIIARDVLVLGRSANEFLNKLADLRDSEDLRARIQTRLQLPAEAWSGGQSPDYAVANTRLPEYPRLIGSLRHSPHRFAIDLDLASGLRDLEQLCHVESCETEGIFVHDTERHTWYSLGGHTEISFRDRRISHFFDSDDLARFGRRPIVVHLHPNALDTLIEAPPHPRALRSQQRQFDRFYAATPSATDLRLFVDLIREASRAVVPEFIIIHRLGRTRVHLGNDLDQVRRLATNWTTLRDDVVLADDTISSLGENGATVATRLFARMNARVGEIMRIEFEPKESP